MSYFKILVWMPIASILSIMILPLRLYWYPRLRAIHLYTKTTRLDQCTHLLVHGRDGNIQVVNLDNITEQVRSCLPQA